MKKTIILLLSFAMVLSGCSLFPLQEDAKHSVELGETVDKETGEAEGDQPGNLVKPAEVDENAEVEDSSTEVMYCIAPANIRDSASSNSNVIGALRTGDKVDVLYRDGSWIEIAYEGRSGFVYERFLSDMEP